MDSFAEEAIQELVCVDLKVVTAVTIARHLDKPIAEANSLLVEFYDKYKKEKSLLAVFSISGQMERNGTPCGAVVLAKQGNLEEIKANFTQVDQVHVFAVHLNEIETVSDVLSHDILEDDKFFRDDATRAKIKCSKVGAFRKEMETKHSEVAKQLDKIIQAKSEEVKKDAPAVEKAKEKKEAKKSDLSKAFERACKREKTPKNSPAKVRESPFSSEKKVKKEDEEEESPQPKPKRARKIIIDDEDEEEVEQKKAEKPLKEKKPARSKLADDDLFEAESPEKDPGFTETTTPVKEEPKRKKAEKETKKKEKVKDENHEAPLRRSPRKHQPAGKRKVMKKVLETFADEDGFLVTKEVLREVSVEPDEEEPAPPKPLSPKKANPVVAAPKAKKTAAPVGQSKISSFFTKK